MDLGRTGDYEELCMSEVSFGRSWTVTLLEAGAAGTGLVHFEITCSIYLNVFYHFANFG